VTVKIINITLIVLFLIICNSCSGAANRPGSVNRELSKSAPAMPAPARDESAPAAGDFGGGEESVPPSPPAMTADKTTETQAKPGAKDDRSREKRWEYPEESVDSFNFEELPEEVEEEPSSDQDMMAETPSGTGGGGAGGGEKDNEGRWQYEKSDEIADNQKGMISAYRSSDKSEEEKKMKSEEEIKKFRVRSRFPEIVFYNPGIITDKNGKAQLNFQTGDSITEYTLSIKAATKDGKWGTQKTEFKAFQPFFIDFDPPSKLHLNDEISMSAAVFNYTDHNVKINFSIQADSRISLLSLKDVQFTIPSSKAIAIPVSIKVTGTGKSEIKITAEGEGVKDTIVRKIEILPDLPERSFKSGGVLKSGNNTISFEIPQNAKILDGDFTLRVFNDPSMGLFDLARKLDAEPHADIERSSAMLQAASSAYFILDRNALLSESEKQELNHLIDTSWIRLLAFRTSDGFSNYPGGKTDPYASLLVLDSLATYESVRVVDEKLKNQLIQNALQVFRGDYITEMKLFAASVVAEYTETDHPVCVEFRAYLDSPLIKNSVDPVIMGLVCRLSGKVSYNYDFKNALSKLKPSQASNVQSTLGAQVSQSIPQKGYIFGLANIIIALSQKGQKLDSPEVAQIKEILENAAWNSEGVYLDRIYAIYALGQLKGKGSASRDARKIVVNGQPVESSPQTILQEFPVNLKSGENRLEIDMGKTGGVYQVVGRYFIDQPPAMQDDLLNYKYKKDMNGKGVISARFAVKNTELIRNSTVHIPLIKGIKPVDSESIMAKKLGADYVEYRSDEIIVYYSDKAALSIENPDFIMLSDIKGSFYFPPVYIDKNESESDFEAGRGIRVNWL
jgi:hypothetical protein